MIGILATVCSDGAAEWLTQWVDNIVDDIRWLQPHQIPSFALMQSSQMQMQMQSEGKNGMIHTVSMFLSGIVRHSFALNGCHSDLRAWLLAATL